MGDGLLFSLITKGKTGAWDLEGRAVVRGNQMFQRLGSAGANRTTGIAAG